MGLKEKIESVTSSILDEVIQIRRHIHQNPELSFQEFETSKFIQKKLTDWKIDFTTGWVETGIVATLQGKNPDSKCIGVRADMDALPILEKNDVPYKSKNEGVMHACGHDVHSSILLGTAYCLSQMKDEFEGTVKFIFQPGEEKLPGGAKLMIEQGVLETPKVDQMIALHVFPDLEAGKIGFRPGMYMASCDEIYLKVKGKGGHGAMPHNTIDPILISAHLVTSLQHLISRRKNPTIPSVLSFGRIEGLGATNVIPDEVNLQGTFRTLNEEWRKEAHLLLEKHANELVKSFGGEIDVDIRKGYPYLENDASLTEKCRAACSSHLGEQNVVDLPIRMTGEDFSFFSHQVPSCFFRLGVRNESEGIVHGVHHSKFNIDEKAIKIGMQSFISIILA